MRKMKMKNINNQTTCSCDNGIIDCPGCKDVYGIDKVRYICAGCHGVGKVKCGVCNGKQKEINTKMTRKWRLIAWATYTVGCFLIMLIGFDWRISIPVSIIVGFVCVLFNEVIQVLLKIQEKIK